MESRGPEEQTTPHAEENPEVVNQRHTALARDLLDIYGGTSQDAYDQIARELERESDGAEVLAIIVDLLARELLDDARAIVRKYAAFEQEDVNWLGSELAQQRGTAFEVSLAAIKIAKAETKLAPPPA